MIKAVLVEDELLVRKGLIMTLPWEKYGIEIVGEASNGRAALEFIKENEVDLLVTDITMPVMSGLELMKEVLHSFPHIQVVIITCHQDFEFIQSALRMGAVDYIVKTQIEDEKIEESLKRISDRIYAGKDSEKNPEKGVYIKADVKNTGLLLVPVGNNAGRVSMTGFNWLQEAERPETGSGCVLVLARDTDYPWLEECFLGEEQLSEWVLVKIRNIQSIPRDAIAGFIRRYLNNSLFYSCVPSIRLYETDTHDREGFMDSEKNEKFSGLRKAWANISCIFNRSEYGRLKALTLEIKPDRARLRNLVYKAAEEWESSLVISLQKGFLDRLESLRFWFQYEKWFSEVREYIAARVNGSAYPDETIGIVLSSLHYVRHSEMKEINQEAVARHFNISRSYFSKAFKDITGSNFIEYMTKVRLDNACRLLLQTDEPIYKIAGDMGFDDEKYFSRVFKDRIGVTPHEYRSKKERASCPPQV